MVNVALKAKCVVLSKFDLMRSLDLIGNSLAFRQLILSRHKSDDV